MMWWQPDVTLCVHCEMRPEQHAGGKCLYGETTYLRRAHESRGYGTQPNGLMRMEWVCYACRQIQQDDVPAHSAAQPVQCKMPSCGTVNAVP